VRALRRTPAARRAGEALNLPGPLEALWGAAAGAPASVAVPATRGAPPPAAPRVLGSEPASVTPRSDATPAPERELALALDGPRRVDGLLSADRERWRAHCQRRADEALARAQTAERNASRAVDPDYQDPLDPFAAALWRDRRADELNAAEHWSRRAQRLAVPFAERAAKCADEAGTVRMDCTTCGLVHTFRVGCKTRASCMPCALIWGRSRAKQVSGGIEGMLAGARREWREHGAPQKLEPAILLLTLTARDSGDLAADLAKMRESWPKLRAWLHARIRASWARRLGCSRDEVPARLARTPFALVWEATDGEAGQGHAHAHAAMVLPYVHVRALSAAWSGHLASVGHAGGGHVQLSRDKRTGRVLRATSGAGAARYLSKYVSKGVFSEDLSAENAAAWVRATYARRVLQASRGLLALGTERPTCGMGNPELGCGAPIDAVGYERPSYPRGPPGAAGRTYGQLDAPAGVA
jgi:hypothetical protein